MFTAKFQPALNKKGYSKLTFMGTEIKEGKNKDGESWEMFLIKFDCLGKFHGSSQIVSVSCGFQYDSDNVLGKTLAAMGYIAPEVKTSVDPDGFEIEDVGDLDDDEFLQTETPKLDFTEFFKSQIDKVFTAKLTKSDRGFWSIDVDTLKPLKTK